MNNNELTNNEINAITNHFWEFVASQMHEDADLAAEAIQDRMEDALTADMASDTDEDNDAIDAKFDAIADVIQELVDLQNEDA